jgi:hypothetical protein
MSSSYIRFALSLKHSNSLTLYLKKKTNVDEELTTIKSGILLRIQSQFNELEEILEQFTTLNTNITPWTTNIHPSPFVFQSEQLTTLNALSVKITKVCFYAHVSNHLTLLLPVTTSLQSD